MHYKTHFSRICLLILLGSGAGCASAYYKSLGGNTAQIFEKIYVTDFNIAWQAVKESLKTSQLDVSNQEGGFVQTKWQDNTAEKNFSDSLGNADAYLKAQYRFRVTVSKGFFNGKQTVKVAVQKEQLVQRDVLEGWRPMESDSIDENTLLYRIGRVIFIRMKINQMEEEKAKKELEDLSF